MGGKHYTPKCKRYDCLYSPPKDAPNNCDYMLHTSHSRDCTPGIGCIHYIKSTAQERKHMALHKFDDLSFWLALTEDRI